MKLSLVILAAGAGSRYGGLKQFESVDSAGHTIIDYSIYDGLRAGFDRVTLVVRRSMLEHFRKWFEQRMHRRLTVEYAIQCLDDLPEGFEAPPQRSKPWGTGQAVLACKKRVSGSFAVINADDFYGASAFVSLAEFLNQVDPGSATYANVTYALRETLSDTGAVSRALCECAAEGWISDIVELPAITKHDGDAQHAAPQGTSRIIKGDTPVSMNMWGFTPPVFTQLESGFRKFLQAHVGSLDAEFLLPTIIRELLHSQQVKVKALRATAAWCGVTYPQDRARVMQVIQRLVQEGAYPTRLWN